MAERAKEGGARSAGRRSPCEACRCHTDPRKVARRSLARTIEQTVDGRLQGLTAAGQCVVALCDGGEAFEGERRVLIILLGQCVQGFAPAGNDDLSQNRTAQRKLLPSGPRRSRSGVSSPPPESFPRSAPRYPLSSARLNNAVLTKFGSVAQKSWGTPPVCVVAGRQEHEDVGFDPARIQRIRIDQRWERRGMHSARRDLQPIAPSVEPSSDGDGDQRAALLVREDGRPATRAPALWAE